MLKESRFYGTLPPSSAVYEARLEPTMLPRARPVAVPAFDYSLS